MHSKRGGRLPAKQVRPARTSASAYQQLSGGKVRKRPSKLLGTDGHPSSLSPWNNVLVGWGCAKVWGVGVIGIFSERHRHVGALDMAAVYHHRLPWWHVCTHKRTHPPLLLLSKPSISLPSAGRVQKVCTSSSTNTTAAFVATSPARGSPVAAHHFGRLLHLPRCLLDWCRASPWTR